MDVSTLPFNKHLGLRLSRSDEELAVILQPCAHHLNHVGTVHAAVVYGVAEAASGHCLLARFPDLVDSYVAGRASTRRPVDHLPGRAGGR